MQVLLTGWHLIADKVQHLPTPRDSCHPGPFVVFLCVVLIQPTSTLVFCSFSKTQSSKLASPYGTLILWPLFSRTALESLNYQQKSPPKTPACKAALLAATKFRSMAQVGRILTGAHKEMILKELKGSADASNIKVDLVPIALCNRMQFSSFSSQLDRLHAQVYWWGSF